MSPLLLPSRRLCYFFGASGCAAIFAAALYLQYHLDQDPCPLCILQRLALLGLGLVYLVAGWHNPRKRAAVWGYTVAAGWAAGSGAAIAARQVWLQQLPPELVPSCGPGLEYILQANPLGRALTVILKGSGECAQVGWTLLGGSIAQWALLGFVLLGLVGLVQPWNRHGPRP